MLLDDYLPEFDVRERHVRLVRAPRAAVLSALKDLRLSDISFVVRWLFAIRDLPQTIVERRSPQRERGARPLLADMVAGGFIPLADTESEIVLGMAGEPWKIVRPRFVSVANPTEFKGLSDPALAKVAFNFTLEDAVGGTMLATETRVRVPDVRARRSFLRYWFVIRRGSELIRILLLRAAARKARNLVQSDAIPTPPIRDAETTTSRGVP